MLNRTFQVSLKNNIGNTDKLSHVSNYNGVYDPDRDYEKFDFVYNTGDGLFYYAREDISANFYDLFYENEERFTLDPEGPVHEGVKTHYIFDSYNQALGFVKGQIINIQGSINENDGDYRVIEINRDFNPNALSASDYSVINTLNAEETSSPGWLVSSWFLLSEKYYYWSGLDYDKYVDNHKDLLEKFISSGESDKTSWGQRHYIQFGKSEGRVVPYNDQYGWIHNTKFGWIFVNVRSADIQNKNFWFQFKNVKDTWFSAFNALSNNEKATVAYRQDPRIDTSFKEYSQLNIDIPETYFDIKTRISSQGNETLIISSDQSEGVKIERLSLENGQWVNIDTITLNDVGKCKVLDVSGDLGTFVLLRLDDDSDYASFGIISDASFLIYSSIDGSLTKEIKNFSHEIKITGSGDAKIDRTGNTIVFSSGDHSDTFMTIMELIDADWIEKFSFADDHLEGFAISGSGNSVSACVSTGGSTGVYLLEKNNGVWFTYTEPSRRLPFPEVEAGEERLSYSLRCANTDEMKDKLTDPTRRATFCGLYFDGVDHNLLTASSIGNRNIFRISSIFTPVTRKTFRKMHLSENGNFLFCASEKNTGLETNDSTIIYALKNEEWKQHSVLDINLDSALSSLNEDKILIYSGALNRVEGRSYVRIFNLINNQWQMSQVEQIGYLDDISSSQSLDKIFYYKRNLPGYEIGLLGVDYSANYKFGSEEGWLHFSLNEDKNKLEIYSISEDKWWELDQDRGLVLLDKKNVPDYIVHDGFTILNNTQTLLDTRIWVKPVDVNGGFKEYEARSNHPIKLSARSSTPAFNQDSWTTDQFFFDADYGSTVDFKCENRKQDFGNGYYKLFPVSVNSVKCDINLTFKNRKNKEANAIIHFVENHLGQLEKDKNNDYLGYSQGISGFRWDGDSTFHPYDSIENQTKTFYCDNFSHSLNFEVSNDISLTLKNLNTSILNRCESLFVKSAPTYDQFEVYQKNDVVFSDLNNKYYYWYNDVGVSSQVPVEKMDSWTRDNGAAMDVNTQYWTREFFWKPSLGLQVDQRPRLKEISLSPKYVQFYNDGINESLLTLNLTFDNRGDDEAYAILHFLEAHLGYMPFLFSPPAPYETPQNFICQEWSHTYKYKENHLITAKFEQYPFNFSAQEFDSSSTSPLVGIGQLIFDNPLTFVSKDNDDLVALSSNFKRRLLLENVGSTDIQISSIEIDDNQEVAFYFVAGDQVSLVCPRNLNADDYIYTLPASPSLPLSLNNKKIRLKKSGNIEGVGGGHFFDTLDTDGNIIKTYFQRNDGSIKENLSNARFQKCRYFIVEGFFAKNRTSVLPAEQEGYIDVVYNGENVNFEDILVDENSNQINFTNSAGNSEGSIVLSRGNGYLENTFTINSSAPFSPQQGKLRIYLEYE